MVLSNKSADIIERLTQWNVQNIDGILEAHVLCLMSSASEESLIFCIKFLQTAEKCFANDSIKNVPKTELDLVTNAIKSCHTCLLKCRSTLSVDNDLERVKVMKLMFLILQNLLPLDVHNGLSISNQLSKELDFLTKCKTFDKNSSNTWTAILKNSYILLWNTAGKFDLNETSMDNRVQALNLRLHGLRFMFLYSTDYVKFCQHATQAAKRCQTFVKNDSCPKLESFYMDVSHLLASIKNLKDLQPLTVPILLKEAFCFLLSQLAYLLSRSLNAEAERVVQNFNRNFFKPLMKSLPNNSKLPATVAFSADVLLIAVHIRHCTIENAKPLSTDLNALFKKCRSFDKPAEEALSVFESCSTFLQTNFVVAVKSLQKNVGFAQTIYAHLPNLKTVLNKFVTALVISSYDKSLPFNYASSSPGNLQKFCYFHYQLLSICASVLDSFQGPDLIPNAQVSTLLEAVMDIAVQFSSLVEGCHHSYGQYYVSSIWNIASNFYNKGLHAEALQLYKTCVKFIKNLITTMDAEDSWTPFFEKIKFISISFCKNGCFMEALQFIAEMMAAHQNHYPDFLEMWGRVKREARVCSPNGEMKVSTTTIKLVQNYLPKTAHIDMVGLLMQEYATYRLGDTQNEKLAVLKELLSKKKTLDKANWAIILIEYAELQLSIDPDPSRPPKTCCLDAIKLLESINTKRKKSPLPSENDCWLAHAYFLLHMFEMQERQAVSEMKVASQSNDAITEKQKIKEEGLAQCNIPPAYQHITMDVEFESLQNLDKSLDLWTSIIELKPTVISNPKTIIRNLKSTAEMYSLVRMVSHEVRAWGLVLAVAKTFSLIVEWGNAVARLVSVLSRNGLTENARDIYQEFKSLNTQLDGSLLAESESTQYLEIYLLLAESELLLMENMISEGWERLQKALNHPKMNQLSTLSILSRCEAHSLLSKYCELPSSVLKSIKLDVEDSSPITLAKYGFKGCLDLLRSIINGKRHTLYKIMDLKPRLINVMLECAMRVGHLFRKIGALREACCFLKEQLLWAQKLSLANRSAEILLELCKLDIMSESYSDCQTKLNGVQYIIDSAGEQLQTETESCIPDSFDLRDDGDSSENDEDHYVCRSQALLKRSIGETPPENSKTSSPELKKINILLNWHDHSSSCFCFKCMQLVFHRLRLELAVTQIECSYYGCSPSKKYLKNYMSTAIRYAKMWRKTERSLLLELASKSRSTITATASKNESVEPVVHIDFILCEALCKLTQMCLKENDLHGAILAIKEVYCKLRDLKYEGLIQTHFILAETIYFYCIVKLNLYAEDRNLTVMNMLYEAWPTSMPGFDEPVADEEVDFLTARLDNIHVGDELTDCFKTPHTKATRTFTFTRKKIIDAPSKMGTALSRFESQFSDPEQSPPVPLKCDESKKQLHGCGRESKIKWSATETSSHAVQSVVSNQENSDAEDRSPVKKLQNARSGLGNIGSGNCKINRNCQWPVMTLSTSPESDSAFVPASSILRAPRASRKKTASVASAAEASTEIPVRRRLRSNARLTDTEETIAIETVRCDDWEQDCCPLDLLADEVHVQAVPKWIDSISRMESNVLIEKDTMHSLIEDIETLRSNSPAAHAIGNTRNSKVKTVLQAVSTPHKKLASISKEKMVKLLENARQMLCHHPCMPLYADLNVLLALFKGEKDPSTASHLFESMAVTLRHRANLILSSKIKDGNKSDRPCPDEDMLKLKDRKSMLSFSGSSANLNDQADLISSRLNNDWVVCQINTVPASLMHAASVQNPDLIITRCQRNRKPIIVKIPSENSLGVTKFTSEMENIFKEIDVTVRLTAKALWWNERANVDNRVKALIKSMEDNWLGPWKGLILGNPSHEDDLKKLKDITALLAKEIKALGFDNLNEDLLEVIVNSCHGLMQYRGLLRKAMAILLNVSYRDERLKKICLVVSKRSLCFGSEIISRQHVILILDKEIQHLPWENIPILCSTPVSRMPSIHILLGHLILYANADKPASDLSVDTSNAFYILNPGNDLPRTEQRLTGTFQNLKWAGIIGKAPNPEAWSCALSKYDLFVYNGHGAGNQYISQTIIQQSDCKATVLLIGCSSAKLKHQGRHLEPDGIVLHYLLAGSPCIVGNLWNVTDKSIDQFLDDLLACWLPGKKQKDKSLCQSIISARQDCLLRYAIGAAPILYGLPIQARPM